MNERHPLDSELLAKAADATTGVEYIQTGTSPYVLEFRRMINRMLRAFERANDLRVYQDGDATFGVRPGRCRVNDNAVIFPGTVEQNVSLNATTYIWIDENADIQTSTTSFPSTAATYLPLATIETADESITTIEDLRGETFLQSPTTSMIGITATAEQINQALDGIGPMVSAATLTLLTAGPDVSVDLLHRHIQCAQSVDGTASFSFINDTTDPSGNFAVVFSLPNLTNHDTILELNKNNLWLQQRHDGVTYNLLGSVAVQATRSGSITNSQTNQLIGTVPVAGQITTVVLSALSNTVSDDPNDGISIDVKVNGTSILTSASQVTAADGLGFRSTDQGNGVAAVVADDGSEVVERGDMLSFDLTYTANGSVTTAPADIVIAVIIRAAKPE